MDTVGESEISNPEEDCDTLMEAEEIKADKQRFQAAMAVAGDRRDAMNKMMQGNRPMSKGGM